MVKEEILSDLNIKQYKDLVSLLKNEGFAIEENTGRINVKHPKKGHPTYSFYGIEVPCPVGYVGIHSSVKEGKDRYIALTNLDKKFPENYHIKIKDILRDTLTRID